jgi:hypothetical protein
LEDDLSGLSTAFRTVPTDLTDNGMGILIESQMLVKVRSVSHGFLRHHFRPKHTSFRKDAKKLPKVPIRIMKHRRNVQLLCPILALHITDTAQ